MSQQSMVHQENIVRRPLIRPGRQLLLVIGLVLIAAFLVSQVVGQSKAGLASSSSSSETVVYSNALARQYAQPWLDKQYIEAVPAAVYSDALARQYAQPWLDKQQTEGKAMAPFSDALALFYVRPWLERGETQACSGRLDMMYACQNGYRQR